jgi:hypothetical protein
LSYWREARLSCSRDIDASVSSDYVLLVYRSRLRLNVHELEVSAIVGISDGAAGVD